MHASVMMVISQSIISIRDYAMKFSLQRKRETREKVKIISRSGKYC